MARPRQNASSQSLKDKAAAEATKRAKQVRRDKKLGCKKCKMCGITFKGYLFSNHEKECEEEVEDARLAELEAQRMAEYIESKGK